MRSELPTARESRDSSAMAYDHIHLPEVLFEFVKQGRYIKVMAVDPKTGTEIAIVGDASATKSRLQKLAIQKLKYVLAKKQQSHSKRDGIIS
jgi:ABC-type transport system involved in Fe-S cluster assembly fused permease/ATPase subunit